MEHREIRDKVLGYNPQSSQNIPPALSAKDLSNVLRGRGALLREPEGYAKRYDLPQATDNLRPQYLDPAIYKVSNLSWRKIYNFFVPEHGGTMITAAIATYRKTGFFTANPTTDRFGIFIRPWWDGNQWRDSWQELTELFVFELFEKSAPNRLYVDDNPVSYDFGALDPGGAVFNTTYFKGWTIVFGQDFQAANDDENYLLVTACGFDTDRFYLEFFGDTGNLGSRNVGDKIAVYRGFANNELPSTIKPHIYSLLNGFRMTSGNGSADVGLAGFFREKTWGWSGAEPAIDRMVCEVQMPDLWRRAFSFTPPIMKPESIHPLPAGEYFLKTSVKYDDGNETELRDPLTSLPFALRTSGDLEIGNGRPRALVSDGTYLYASVSDEAAPNTDIRIAKIRLSDFSVVATASITSAGFTDYQVTALLHEGGVLYVFGANAPGTGFRHIFKIAADTLTLLGTIDLGANANAGCRAMVSDGTYIYVGIENIPGTIIKVNIAGGVYDSELNTWDGVNPGAIHAMVIDGTTLWAGLFTIPGKVVKVDLTTFTVTTTVTLGDDLVEALVIHGSTLYAGLATFPAKIVGIPTGGGGTTTLTLSAGINVVRSLVHDGTHLFALCISGGTDYLVRCDGVSSQLEALDYPYAETAENDLHYENNVIYGTAYSNKRVLRFNPAAGGILSDGTLKLTTQVLLCPATTPKRAREIRLYLSDDGIQFFFTKRIGLLSGETTWDAAAFFDTLQKHEYVRSAEIEITNADWEAAQAEASVQIGRAISDSGVVRYLHGAVVGTKAYLSGVRADGILSPNKVFVSTVGGDGAQMFDVFPNNALRQIDLEYNDGDECRAVGPLVERALVLKRKMAVLVSPSGAGFRREVQAVRDGIAAPDTLVSWEDEAYWLGYNGVYRFSTREGQRLINAQWLEELLAMSDATKEAAFAVLDAENRRYRLFLNRQEYVYSFDDREWDIEDLTDAPSAYAVQPGAVGKVDFLAGEAIFTLGEDDLYAGGPVDIVYEFNQFKPDNQAREDILPQFVHVQYESDIDVLVELFLEDDVNPVTSTTLSANDKEGIVFFPPGARGKGFRMRFTATKDTTGHEMRIRVIDPHWERVPFGDLVMQ